MKKKRLYFAVDFDGTIVTDEFPEIGKIKKKSVAFLELLRASGHCIIIWTCRGGQYLKEAQDFLDAHGIPYDYLNENPENSFGDDTRKLFAHYYIDDRAINVRDVGNLMIQLDEEGVI